MENNNQENKNKNPSKFNAYWIYGVVAVVLLGLQLVNLPSKSSEPITFDKFEEMARKGDVEKLEVVNQKDAYVYLTPEAALKTEYQDASKSNFRKKPPALHFRHRPSRNILPPSWTNSSARCRQTKALTARTRINPTGSRPF